MQLGIFLHRPSALKRKILHYIGFPYLLFWQKQQIVGISSTTNQRLEDNPKRFIANIEQYRVPAITDNIGDLRFVADHITQ